MRSINGPQDPSVFVLEYLLTECGNERYFVFSNSQRKGGAMPQIPEGYQEHVCLFGKGAEACCFLSLGADGFQREKGSSLSALLDARRRAGTMRALGDNCSGSPDFTLPDVQGGVQ